MYKISKWLFHVIIVSLLINPTLASAYAGKVVFAYGEVTAENQQGIVRTLHKRSEVNSGDLIKTSSRSMVQIRMIDKAFIALRSNSELRIDSYNMGATKEEDSSVFSLLRGGFRAVTGIIGKRFKSAYKMRTVNATIGIRGTDYTARLCQQDCNQGFASVRGQGSVADGLYVGVNDGGIELTNKLGSLSLDELQYGYVKDAASRPVALPSAPEFLFFNSKAPDPEARPSNDAEANSTSESVKKTVASRTTVEPNRADVTNDENIKQDLKADRVEVDQDQIEKNVTFDQTASTDSGSLFSLASGSIESSRMVSTSYYDTASSTSTAISKSNVFGAAKIENNKLSQFESSSANGQNTIIGQGTASVIEQGFDPSTGIAWGRWGGGSATILQNNSLQQLDLSKAGLHWIASPDQTQKVALPSSGTASYQLIGNTSPTDNFGNSGIVGSATLDANFTNSTVNSSVSLGINNNVWTATATNLPINDNGSFNGNFSSVNVSTSDGNVAGSGTATGFLTNNGAGAGLGYSLDANISGAATSVNGSAVFEKK